MMFHRRDVLKLSSGAAISVVLGGQSLIAIAQDGLKLRLQLGWIANVEYAGVWLALERGYFRQRGIDLQYAAGGPNSPPSPVVVASGNADIAYTTWLPFLDAVARGNEFVMIGATFPISPLGIISLAKRPIRVPADLVDAKILAQGPNEKTAIDATLTLAGLPVRWTMVPAGFSPEPLLAGDAQGYTAFGTNQVITLERMGLVSGKDFFFTSFDALGFRSYASVLFTSRAFLEKNRPRVVGFLEALIRGWLDNEKDPSAAPKLVIEKFGKDYGLDPAQQTRQNQLQIPLVRAAAPRPILTLDREVIAGPMMAAARATGRINLPDIAAIIDFKVAEEANALL
jgi:ABC-type nitrate/sulfonate/bicarbonate transport system substrate-binding protein